jgi:hypothetical protein
MMRRSRQSIDAEVHRARTRSEGWGATAIPDRIRVQARSARSGMAVRAPPPTDAEGPPKRAPTTTNGELAREPYTSSRKTISVASDFRGPSFRIRV